MQLPKTLSIKTKLNLLTFVVGGVALLLSAAAFVVNDVQMICSSKAQQLSALAKVLGSNSAAALTFDDPAAAREVLASLALQPTVKSACLFDAKGRVFASFAAATTGTDLPTEPPPDGHRYQGNQLVVVQTITHDNTYVGKILLMAGMDDLRAQLFRYVAIVAIVLPLSLAAAMGFSQRLQRIVSDPVLKLARTAQQISAKDDYSIRVEKKSNDELGTLYDEFNAMLDQIEQGKRQLQAAHDQLEARVAERTRQLSEANQGLGREIAERRRAEQQLADVHQQLVDAARRAGMAEIATGVLHNVGNVLNSVNVSATLVADRLRNSKIAELNRVLDLIDEHAAELGRFFSEDRRGKQLPGFLRLLADHLGRNRSFMLEELQSLTRHIDHIKTIVVMQQSYAGVAGVIEAVALPQLLDDAIKLNSASLAKYNIDVVREYEDLPEIRIDKQRVLQILVNLVTNAKDALIESGAKQPCLTARIALRAEEEDSKLLIEVRDNGIGIAWENLVRVFSHGFTTKKHGHGFGLHSSANAAKELGGTLTARSEGGNRGAVFTLELPFEPVEVLV